MWYVIQTKTGEEERVVALMNSADASEKHPECIVPLYEQVRRNSSSYQLRIRRLFPGYIFVDTDDPDRVAWNLKKVPEFTRVLGARDEEDHVQFLPVEEEEVAFLKTLISDGMLHLSFVRMKQSRVDRVIGPLSDYVANIMKLDIQHRRAIVEKDIFGKRRKIYFGLWTEDDPEHPWIHDLIEGGEEGVIPTQIYDIGFHEGDLVRGINGIYEENVMRVLSVDGLRRRLTVEIELFGRRLPLPIYADDVEKVGKNTEI